MWPSKDCWPLANALNSVTTRSTSSHSHETSTTWAGAANKINKNQSSGIFRFIPTFTVKTLSVPKNLEIIWIKQILVTATKQTRGVGVKVLIWWPHSSSIQMIRLIDWTIGNPEPIPEFQTMNLREQSNNSENKRILNAETVLLTKKGEVQGQWRGLKDCIKHPPKPKKLESHLESEFILKSLVATILMIMNQFKCLLWQMLKLTKKWKTQ